MKNIIRLKNFMSLDDALSLRKHIIQKYSEKTMVYGPDVILEDTELVKLLRNFKEYIRLTYGTEIFLTRELQIQINRRDNRGKNEGWHIDGSQEINNSELLDPYVSEQNYQLFKVGIYLQGNDNKNPGGIDVKKIPNIPTKIVPKLLRYPFLLIITSMSMKLLRGTTIENAPGEAILFDSKMPHRATPKTDMSGSESNKVVFYFNASFNPDVVDRHHMFMYKMALFGDANEREHYRRALSSSLDDGYKGISKDLPDYFKDTVVQTSRNLFNAKMTVIPEDYLIRSVPVNSKRSIRDHN